MLPRILNFRSKMLNIKNGSPPIFIKGAANKNSSNPYPTHCLITYNCPEGFFAYIQARFVLLLFGVSGKFVATAFINIMLLNFCRICCCSFRICSLICYLNTLRFFWICRFCITEGNNITAHLGNLSWSQCLFPRDHPLSGTPYLTVLKYP